jgi:hypothetical protein
MITARFQIAGAGTQDSALVFGGTNDASSIVGCTEEYNGTSWTVGGALITARSNFGGRGASNSSALAFGGTTPARVTCTESYAYRVITP